MNIVFTPIYDTKRRKARRKTNSFSFNSLPFYLICFLLLLTTKPVLTQQQITKNIFKNPNNSVQQTPRPEAANVGRAKLDPTVRAASIDIVRRYNCGGPQYIDSQGNKWEEDNDIANASGGSKSYRKDLRGRDIENTIDDELYATYRVGQFSYEIPLPNGDYEIFLYFAEINFDLVKERIFSITIQDKTVFNKIDLILLGKKKNYVAIRLEYVAQVVDTILRIGFVKDINQSFISAMEVMYLKPHLAHAVSSGPYFAVDRTNSLTGELRVDGSLSHTHGVGLFLEVFEWRIGAKVIGTGEITDLNLPVGEHTITFFVKDSDGNTDSEVTTITVFPFGYPAIDDVYPTTGNIDGGSIITIYGSGFKVSDNSVRVRFGDKLADQRFYKIINDEKMEVKTPAASQNVPVDLVVETSKGISNAVPFTYVSGSPIAFISQQLKNFQIGLPTVLTFDNDGLLFVATAEGKIAKLKLSDDFTEVKGSVVSSVLSGRTILGIAADPMSPQGKTAIYVSHSQLFHGEFKSTSGLAINGKVSRIEGANLDVVVDIISNLPVSDHDHSVNGLEFGDNGELYVQIGGSTNAGVPGRLTGLRLQKENPLSAATIVAQLTDPKFNGEILYDADDDGNVVGGSGVQLFASGQRNSFDMTLHSNGNLYATDNGPNNGFGKQATGCGPKQEGNDPDEPDKLNLLLFKRYYGHPNRKRGERDKKQCTWRSVNEPSNADYKGPMMTFSSSTTGIIEFQTNQFEGQLRKNLILSKYKDGLFRVILSANGKDVIPQSIPPIPLVGDNTLAVTQAPDGTLIDTRYTTNQVFVHLPILVIPAPNLLVFGVFPRRGGEAGGYILSIYGFNFQRGTPLVSVGERKCIVLTVKPKRITCRAFGGVGKVDVRVTIGTEKVTLTEGFRYIKGAP